jgi:membrane glycosyltransferase
VQPFQLFPLWPEWRPERAIALLSITFAVLFVPKILASLLVQAKGFGGRMRLALSVIVECMLSALLAPVRMLFHTQFVVASLLGRAVRWRSPARSDTRTDWTQALRRHGVHTMFAIAWAALVWHFDPQFLPWLVPIVGALMLSVPLSVFTSRAGAGRALRRLGLFVIPEEVQTPPVLAATRRYLREVTPSLEAVAVVDPILNVDTLTKDQRAALFVDPQALARRHAAIATSDAHPSRRADDDRAPSKPTMPMPHLYARTELPRSAIVAPGD